jgi:hypothetical protein
MRRMLVIAQVLTMTLSAFGQTVGVTSYIGDMQEATVSGRPSARLLMFHTETPTLRSPELTKPART